MRPKVILRRLERHRELQRLRVSGELAEAREGWLERRRDLRQLRVSVASYPGHTPPRGLGMRLRVSGQMAEATGTNHFTFTHPSSRLPLVSHDTPSNYLKIMFGHIL